MLTRIVLSRDLAGVCTVRALVRAGRVGRVGDGRWWSPGARVTGLARAVGVRSRKA